jgi:NADPH-dependent 2,4-dienoyl-CoA reductase/sulfur reductase-like enzyme
MTKKYDLIIIGGGPAGITLTKRLAKTMKVAVIRPEDFSLVYCAMPYVIEDLIDKHKCFKKDELITDAGGELIRDMVTSVDFKSKTLLLQSGNSLAYDKLVIASGANPFIPKIEGADLKGVMGFKTQQDLELVASYVENGLQKAIIVGAGAIGIELAQALKNKGIEVIMIDMASQVLPNLVGPEFSQLASEQIVKNGIHLILDARVEKLKGKDFVEEVHLDTGEIIDLSDYQPCIVEEDHSIKGLVIFATGVIPELSFVQGTELQIDRQGIVVNERMETNLPDVYAVGDCVQFNHFITGQPSAGKLATNAVPMAAVLANNLLGKPSTYKGFINGAATKVYDNFVGGTGLTVKAAQNLGFEVVKAYSQATTQFPIMPGKKDLRVKLIADKKTRKIIGGQVFSGEPVTSLVDLITFAIQKEATADDLVELSYSAQPYQSFFPAGNVIVMAAEGLIAQLEN